MSADSAESVWKKQSRTQTALPIRIECQRGTGCDFARPKQYAGTRHLPPARTTFGTGHHFRPDVVLYDSLLTSFLHDRNINLPHRLLHLHKGSKWDSTILYIDTLVNIGTPAMCLLQKPWNIIILSTSIQIKATVSSWNRRHVGLATDVGHSHHIIRYSDRTRFSFWFLIRTILKQKTLEEMKSDFTNNITHELKTPIAVAYAANDALLNFNQAEEKAQRDKYLRICQEQLQRLSGLVEQILSMSMERRRTFRLHPESLQYVIFWKRSSNNTS